MVTYFKMILRLFGEYFFSPKKYVFDGHHRFPPPTAQTLIFFEFHLSNQKTKIVILLNSSGIISLR